MPAGSRNLSRGKWKDCSSWRRTFCARGFPAHDRTAAVAQRGIGAISHSCLSKPSASSALREPARNERESGQLDIAAVSQDDLRTPGAAVLSPGRLRSDAPRRRFVWGCEGRDPSESERGAAILASAALLASRKVGRQKGKQEQETQVEDAFPRAGLVKAPTRRMATAGTQPAQMRSNAA